MCSDAVDGRREIVAPSATAEGEERRGRVTELTGMRGVEGFAALLLAPPTAELAAPIRAAPGSAELGRFLIGVDVVDPSAEPAFSGFSGFSAPATSGLAPGVLGRLRFFTGSPSPVGVEALLPAALAALASPPEP
jgi:hypothetical protein